MTKLFLFLLVWLCGERAQPAANSLRRVTCANQRLCAGLERRLTASDSLNMSIVAFSESSWLLSARRTTTWPEAPVHLDQFDSSLTLAVTGICSYRGIMCHIVEECYEKLKDILHHTLHCETHVCIFHLFTFVHIQAHFCSFRIFGRDKTTWCVVNNRACGRWAKACFVLVCVCARSPNSHRGPFGSQTAQRNKPPHASLTLA